MDEAIAKFLFGKVLKPMTAKQKVWGKLRGSGGIELIVTRTAGDGIRLDQNVIRLCRSTIEASTTRENGIMMNVLSRFSTWRQLHMP